MDQFVPNLVHVSLVIKETIVYGKGTRGIGWKDVRKAKMADNTVE